MLLVTFLSVPVFAAEPKNTFGPAKLGEHIEQIIKKFVRILVPTILDDLPSPPKP